jgi:hypothetical protein
MKSLSHSLLNSPVCLNGRAGKKRLSKPIIDLLPELLVRALARHDDFIVTCETDPDKKRRSLSFRDNFVTSCLLEDTDGPGRSAAGRGALGVSRKWV